MKKNINKFCWLSILFLTFCTVVNAQIKYDNNKTVSSTQSVTGWIIMSENVTVANGAKLTFNAGESVIINNPFTVNTGSQIEIFAN